MSAGWEPSEALKVFNDVNSDGEGGVGIEEFEAWWKGLLEREVRCFLCPISSVVSTILVYDA